MTYVIFAFCVVAAVVIHCAFVRPVLNAFRRKREEDERREIIERARIAAAKLSQKAPRELPDTRGGKLAAEREWRGA